MILEDIANLFEELCVNHTHKEIASNFGRERKFVINVKNGCNFIVNPEFIAGLLEYGYELKLVKIGSEKNEKNEGES